MRLIEPASSSWTMAEFRSRAAAHVLYLVQWMEDGCSDVEALKILKDAVEHLEGSIEARGGKPQGLSEVDR